MIIYNITIKIEISILDEWMKWQLEEHIPEIMSTNLFDDYKIFELLMQDDDEGKTFVFQYHTSSINSYEKYIQEYAEVLRVKSFKKWGNAFIAFRSVLKSVH